uniref:Uncharacterized protein n=1 Tax=Rhizophora mucronata TaxID=61149 RepID=A0A2P2MZJ5_RHIMU
MKMEKISKGLDIKVIVQKPTKFEAPIIPVMPEVRKHSVALFSQLYYSITMS